MLASVYSLSVNCDPASRQVTEVTWRPRVFSLAIRAFPAPLCFPPAPALGELAVLLINFEGQPGASGLRTMDHGPRGKSTMKYDALLLVSFGGPESKEDVIPFLQNVLRGRNVPQERMLEVAEHYYHFDGSSPINRQNRELIAAIQEELARHGIQLPVYWGNRNWHPLLPDTLQKMREDKIESALAFVTSAYSSYSGCRQYRENIAAAQAEVGPEAPRIDKLRVFYNHPGYIEATIDRVREAFSRIPEAFRKRAHIVYTAHSIPAAMARSCDYVRQLEEVRRLVSSSLGHTNDALVYQSRSGPPSQPWLEPDILDYLREVKAKNLATAVV